MASKRITLAAGLASVCAFGGIGLFACGDTDAPVNELVVAVDTTGPIPAGGYQMYLEVKQGTSLTTTEIPFLVGSSSDTNNKLLPATLGVTSASGSSDPVLIRLLTTTPSTNSSVTPIAEREVSVVIPQNRVSLLRLPIDALCFNGASIETDGGVLNNVNPIFPASVCPTGQTCIAGSCQDNTIDAATLVPFSSTSALGGGTSGQCFPLEAAFLSSASASFRTSEPISSAAGACTVTLPPQIAASDLPSVNVGVPVDPSLCSAYGTPASAGCVVPLDFQANAGSPQAGWSPIASVGSGPITLLLPPGVCTVASAMGQVVISTGTPSKIPANPVCGPWAVVGSADTGDGGGALDIADATINVDGGGNAADASAASVNHGFGLPIAIDDVPNRIAVDGGALSDFAIGANDIFTTAPNGVDIAFNSLTGGALNGAQGNEVANTVALANPDYNLQTGQLSYSDSTGKIFDVNATTGQVGAAASLQGTMPSAGGPIVGLASANDGVYAVNDAGALYRCVMGDCNQYTDEGVHFLPPLVTNTTDGGTGVIVPMLNSDFTTYDVLGITLSQDPTRYGHLTSVTSIALAGTGTGAGNRIYMSATEPYDGGTNIKGIFYSDIGLLGSPGPLTQIAFQTVPGPIAATSHALFFWEQVGQGNTTTGLAPEDGGLPPAGIYGCRPDLTAGCDTSNTSVVVDFGPSQTTLKDGTPDPQFNTDNNPTKMRVVGSNLYWLSKNGVVRGISLDSQLTDQ